MKKALRITLVAMAGTSLFIGGVGMATEQTGQAAVQQASIGTYGTVLNDTQNYILNIFSANQPGFASEWPMMALARNGYDGYQTSNPLFSAYYGDVVKQLKEKKGVLSTSKYTEYSRLAIALAAIGQEPQNVAGYNLFDYLSDYNNTVKQGINGADFTLIAVDSKSEYHFTEPAGVTTYTTKEKLVDYILGKEISGGGWSLYGKTADVDITAMTLQALTPYQEDSRVQAAINRGVNKLSALQKSNGSFSSQVASGSETSESSSQVVTALSGLGIDSNSDARFVKDKSALAALLTYHVSGSGFMHLLPGTASNGGAQAGAVDGMATEQADYALVAYNRFKKGSNRLYDMNDVATQSDQEKAQAVAALIKNLGTITSTNQAAAITAARNAYDSLTQAQKKLIPAEVYNLLTTAEAKVAELEQAQQAEAGQTEQTGDQVKQTTQGTATSQTTTAGATQQPVSQTSNTSAAPASATPDNNTETTSVPVENADATTKETPTKVQSNQVQTTDSTASLPTTDEETNSSTPARKKTKSGWNFGSDTYLPKSKNSAASATQTPKKKKTDFWAITKASGLAVGFQGLVIGLVAAGKLWLKKGIL